LFARQFDLAELILDRSPVTIKRVRPSDQCYSCQNTIVEDLEVTRDDVFNCYRLVGMERQHEFVWESLHCAEVTDPKRLALIEDSDIQEKECGGLFTSKETYRYAKGWVTLKERKYFSATLCGELLIID
jgi:hypothetical protein